jgi:two-component system sensor histidine kinase KdpD
VAVVTALCSRVLSVNASTAGFAYLIAVLGIATAWGLVEAIAASVAAMLCFNFFFLPPIGRFTITDPENWVALFAFLATALVASHLSDRAKKQAEEAGERQRETEQLYALSRAILLSEPGQSIGSQAAQHIARVFECRGVALYDAITGEIFLGGPEDLPNIEARLKQVVIQGASLRETPDLLVAAVTLGGSPIGSLALMGITLSDGALQALLNLVAITLERVRTEEARNRAEVARQSEEFKSTLLDAIAHEFKTPLTSIKAASTSILTDAAALTPQLRELASIIDEETDRLNLLVTEAVHMSRIDAGKIHLDRQSLVLKDLVERVLDYFGPRLEGRELELKTEERLPRVWADAELMSLALRQLIDNSLKFSPPASPIEIAAEAAGERVIVRIRDHGPGIPEWERERIFEKFYRREMAKDRVPGSGLGLHIAREIVRAHGGDLWVESAAGLGSEFCLALPVRQDGHQP